jgi:hypothetical protein
MLEWAYAEIEGHCGRCGALLTIGDPVGLLAIPGVKRRLPRCVECVGPVPADLPPFVLPTRPPRHEPPPPPQSSTEWMPYRDTD